MFKSISRKVNQMTCDHSDVKSGSVGALLVSSVDFYTCRKCGLKADDQMFSSSSNKRKYKKLEHQWMKQRGIR